MRAIGLGSSLGIAHYTELFGLLMDKLAYEWPEGPEIAYRLEWLGT